MPEHLLSKIVGEIVDVKLAAFRLEMRLELAPVHILLQSHKEQMAEIRASNSTIAAAQARESGTLAAFRDDQQRNHQSNERNWNTALSKMEKISGNINRMRGREQQVGEDEEHANTRKHHVREWLKVAGSFVSISAVGAWLVKMARDLWSRHHPPH